MTLSFARRPLLAPVALVACSLAAAAAEAGPPEFIESLAQHPTDPNRLVLHYDAVFGGLLYSSDRGKSFDIHPGLAFTQSGFYRFHPVMEYTPDNRLVVGSAWDGLFVSDATGCIKPQDAEQPGSVFDMVAHPGEPGVLLFVGNKTEGSRSGLWKRDAAGTVTQLGVDDGATFTAYGLAVLSRQASSEQLRFVEVGLREAAGVFRTSDDLGQTWTEHPIPVADGLGGTPRLLAVQGGEVVKLVVSMVREASVDPFDPILVTTNTGATFTPYLDTVFKTGQAVVAPGGKLYLSDMGTSVAEGGLWEASEIGAPLTKIVDYSVHCLGYDKEASQLYLCKGYELGRLDPASKAYCRIYQLNETQDFVCDLAAIPKFSEDDTTSVAERVKQSQMCGGWCGASHYASSPFCANYNDFSPTCGLAARAYDMQAPVGQRWVEPPGTDEPRCAGFEPPAQDGGVDAGANQDAGAADAATTLDGESPRADAAVIAPGKKSDGDSGCSAGPSGRGPSGSWLVALALLTGLRLRRRARG